MLRLLCIVLAATAAAQDGEAQLSCGVAGLGEATHGQALLATNSKVHRNSAPAVHEDVEEAPGAYAAPAPTPLPTTLAGKPYSVLATQQQYLPKEVEDNESSLPGANDTYGPNALGDTAEYVHPALGYGLVALVFLVAGSPMALTAYYYYFNPGMVDSSPGLLEEQGGPLPTAVCKAAHQLCKAGHVFFKFGMFLVYFWFGILKVLGISPAEPLVQIIYRELPFLQVASADWFCKYAVGAGEVAFSFIFLFTLLPFRTIRFYCTVFSIVFGMGHLLMVSLLPMVLFPNEVWQEGRFPYALTFEGQYIVKNVVLLAGFMMMGNDLTNPELRKERPTIASLF